VGSHQSTEPVAIAVGDERALRFDEGDAAVCFGLGPATGRGADEHRLHRVTKALDLDGAVWLRQVHGAEIVSVSEPLERTTFCAGAGDGLITAQQGIALVIWTADCVPVLLAAPNAVAAVHAGWRGTVADVVPAAVHRLTGLSNSRPETVTAILGPAVCGRHYPVGREVIDALASSGVDDRSWLDGDRVDLRGFLAAQLEGLGVARVRTIDACTFADTGLASYRRDGDAAGRQWSLVFRTPATKVQRPRSQV
jgi:YfiH family protein